MGTRRWNSWADLTEPCPNCDTLMRCRRPDLVVTGPHLVDAGFFKFSESVGHTVSGSVGLVEHFRSNSHEGS